MADTNNTERAEWKLGDEYLPFHPSASHVDPAYRDGWNACFHAGRASLAAGGEAVAWMDAERGEVVSAKWLASDEATSDYRATYTTPLYTAPQPADALGDGWMDISTAPKDGTDILITNGKDVTVGHWFHEEPYIREHRDLEGGYIGQDESDGHDDWIDWAGGIPDPTHWRPLPLPPAPPTLNASKER